MPPADMKTAPRSRATVPASFRPRLLLSAAATLAIAIPSGSRGGAVQSPHAGPGGPAAVHRTHWLEGDELKVELSAEFPRVLRYERKPGGAVLWGADPGSPAVVVINGTRLAMAGVGSGAPGKSGGCRVTPFLSADVARYRLEWSPPAGSVSLDLRFTLEGGVLRMRMENVEERGGAELRTLYFPDNALLTVRADQAGATLCRMEYTRDPERGIIRTRGTTLRPLAELEPDAEPVQTHWALVRTDRLVGTLHGSIPVFPVHSLASGEGGRVTSASLWNGEYHHRVRDIVMPLLDVRICVTADANGDGVVNWVDGALWLRDRIPDLPPAYDDSFMAKILCCRLPDSRAKFDRKVREAKGPVVYCTFDQALDRIREFRHLTDGAARQIVYLVGWQHSGHDDKYPDLSVVNPLLGGRERLVSLMERARSLDAVVSLHVNFDAMYRDSPAWDPDIIRRNRAGGLFEWSVMHDATVWHISHFKDVRKGGAFRRIDGLLAMLPVRDTIHFDAFRHTNDSWEPDGLVDINADLWGCRMIIERFGRHGITVTTESSTNNPALLGTIKGSWHTGLGSGRGSEFPWFIMHRKLAGGSDKAAERIAFGDSGGDGEDTPGELAEQYYLKAILWNHFRHREIRNVRDDGNLLEVEYRPSCTALYDRARKMLTVVSDGIEIARGGDRFVPVGGDRILVFSEKGGAMEWRLPGSWLGARPTLHRLTAKGREPGPACRVDGGVIRFPLEARQPCVLVKAGG